MQSYEVNKLQLPIILLYFLLILNNMRIVIFLMKFLYHFSTLVF